MSDKKILMVFTSVKNGKKSPRNYPHHRYDSYALKLNPKVIFITSAVLIASIVIINNRLQSRQAKKKSILAISNVFWSNDSELQNRERPVLIDYNGK